MGFRAWEGTGFQIEHPNLESKDAIVLDLIFITNENITPVGSEKLRTTELFPQVQLPDGYEKHWNR